jgi:hypothetical protein
METSCNRDLFDVGRRRDEPRSDPRRRCRSYDQIALVRSLSLEARRNERRGVPSASLFRRDFFMSKTSVASPSTVFAVQATALALALVVALELAGAYALAQSPHPLEPVATSDGATLYMPGAPRVARVEISVVAQADTPAR